MRKIKGFVKKLIIVYVVAYVLLGSIGTTSYATLQNYSEECGEYLAEYAREFIATYGIDGQSKYGGPGHNEGEAEQYVDWEGGSYGEGTFWSCCTSGVWYMYQQALGINIYDMGYSAGASNNLNLSNEYFETHSVSEAQPGDILVREEHVELVLTDGATEHANFGHYSRNESPHKSAMNVHSDSDSFTCVIRLKSSVEVDPSGTVSSSRTTTTSVNLSDFYFNGIPDGKYSIASTNIFEAIIEALSTVADYIIGIITYGIRVVIVGWTALFDQIITNFVNELTGGSVTSDGVSSVEIQSADNSERVTIENLVYNLYDPLNINIFSAD